MKHVTTFDAGFAGKLYPKEALQLCRNASSTNC